MANRQGADFSANTAPMTEAARGGIDAPLRRSPTVNGTAGDGSASHMLMQGITGIATASGLKRERVIGINQSEIRALASGASSQQSKADSLALLSAAPTPVSPVNPAQMYFMSTQEWDGHITEVNHNSFEAVIVPVGASDYVEDGMTVPLDQIDDGIRAKLAPGVLFRLAAGNVRVKRQVMHAVRIYFRADTGVGAPEIGLTAADFEAAFDA